ncbi:hypothetical protein C6P98_19065 [Burkholderia multivorans]|uniref:Uncharacterized protein n=1 Tax=Burkholderia multivorans TaxID=87883 RepID=A0A8E2URJ0_9BURK|nr:hypothetical protein C6P98_19065 [Burkholderia multivorans]
MCRQSKRLFRVRHHLANRALRESITVHALKLLEIIKELEVQTLALWLHNDANAERLRHKDIGLQFDRTPNPREPWRRYFMCQAEQMFNVPVV